MIVDIDKLKNYIAAEIRKYKTVYTNSNVYDYDKAFTCYVFSLLKDKSLDSVREELYARVDDLTLDAAAYLSLAYSNSGKASDLEKAKTINGKIRPYLQPDQRGFP